MNIGSRGHTGQSGLLYIFHFFQQLPRINRRKKTVGLWFDPCLRFSVALQVFKVAARQEFKDLQRTKDSLIV